MDILFVVIGIILVFGGIIGSFLPVIPGPITSWFGLLFLYLTSVIPINYTLLIITLIIALGIFILDYFIPGMGAKRFGGSRYGIIGTTIGLLIGLFFFPPFGIVLGPFLGALLGEFAYGATSKDAVKAAFGSLIGLLSSVFLKFIVAIVYAGIFFWVFFKNIQAII